MGTTRFPFGVTTATYGDLLGEYPRLDPFKIVQIEDDFMDLSTGRWTVVETQAGATQAVTDGHGGLLLLTNSAADNDINAIVSNGESFLLSATKKAWFRCRLAISHATDAEFYAGLAVGSDADPFAGGLPGPGIGFHIADGSAALQFHMDDTGTAVAVTSGLATVVAATMIEVGWYYDGRGKLTLYVDGAPVYTQTDVTEWPDSEEIRVFVGVKNGSANARTLTIDYIAAGCER